MFWYEALQFRMASTVAMLLLLFSVPAFAQQLGRDYVIRVAEMDDDVAVFEVFLPEKEAGRKNVLHRVLDGSGALIASEKFNTGDGHYKVAMVGSYVHGQEYQFNVDTAYGLKFVYKISSKTSS